MLAGIAASLGVAGALGPAAARPTAPRPRAEPWARQLIEAAGRQIGVTTIYDPAYVRLVYPGGDVPRERGVCTDVVIRAYRDAFGMDLQKLLHEDMRKSFAAYPRRWGLAAPDPNIDHRRVPNLEAYFSRHGHRLPHAVDLHEFAPGDLVTQMLAGKLPHIVIVAEASDPASGRPLAIHNIGAGTRLDDVLAAHPVTGRYRLRPA